MTKRGLVRFTKLALGAHLVLGGCALESDAENAPSESAGDAEQPLLFDFDLGDFPIPCDPRQSDTCCDPRKYESCYLQPGPADADIKIKFYECLTDEPGWEHDVHCPLEPGWSAIGGGGHLIDVKPGDASLHRSWASGNGWNVMSTGQLTRDGTKLGARHRLSAYAIGVKMKGHDFAPIHTTFTASSALSHPHAAARVPTGEILLGGGFETEPQMFITDAFAFSMLNGTWHVTASDLDRGNIGNVLSLALSIPPCPRHWSHCFGPNETITQTSATGTGYQIALPVNDHTGSLITGLGFDSSSRDRALAFAFPAGRSGNPHGGALIGNYSATASGNVKGLLYTLRPSP